ncbi:hypothetical protein CsatB_027066 [Cannabis sativa]
MNLIRTWKLGQHTHLNGIQSWQLSLLTTTWLGTLARAMAKLLLGCLSTTSK